ncbi:MAG: PAS domain-containing protein [Bacteroidetes bacterium]|nr:PAS domain-containing protein [Bacteroidota bacterium]
MTPLQDYIYSLQAVLKTSVDRIFLSTPAGKFICANESFCKYVSYSDTDIKKKSVEDVFGKTNWKLIKKELASNFSLEQSVKILKSKEKSSKIFAFNLILEGVHEAIVFVLPVISKEDLALMKKYRNDNFVKALNSRTDSAWFLADVFRGKYLFTSDGYFRLFGWPGEYFKTGGGAFFLSLIHPADVKVLMDHYGEWLIMKNKLGLLYDSVSFTHTLRMKNSNGEYMAIETEANVVQRNSANETLLLMGSYAQIPESLLSKGSEAETFGNIRLIDGKSYIDIDHVRDLGLKLTSSTSENKFKNLSSRESEILKLIIDGHSSEEICEKLFISIHTVNMHRKQVLKKLRAKNLAELIRIYYTAS